MINLTVYQFFLPFFHVECKKKKNEFAELTSLDLSSGRCKCPLLLLAELPVPLTLGFK
ncbi:hypothetical protein HanPSC8_Chr06g0242931 [Helianthus annuus]|nr:hypothetical protein HanPSC8_Chr06g0242931 [Helianthus annuus]